MKYLYYYIVVFVLCFFILAPLSIASPVQQDSKKVEQLNRLCEKADSCLNILKAEESLVYIKEGFRIIGRSKKYEALRLRLRYTEAMCYAYLTEPDYDKAEELFLGLLREYPAINYLAGPELGLVYLEKNQFGNAVQVLEECMESVSPKYRDAEWETRTTTMLAFAYIHNNQRDKASELLYLLLNPENPIYVDPNDFKEAVVSLYYEFIVENGNIIWNDKVGLEMLRLLCAFTKDDDPAWNLHFTMQHGEMSMILGDFKTALDDFQYCIDNYTPDLNKPLFTLLLDKSGAMSRLGRFTEAHALLDTAKVQIENTDNPEWRQWGDIQVKFERAILYLDEGIHYDLAASSLEELLDNHELDKTTRATYTYDLAQAYAHTDLNKAILTNKEALRLYDETEGHSVLYAKTLNRLGREMLDLGDHSSAIKYYELAIDIFRRLSDDNNYSYIQTLSNAAECAFKTKQYGRAIAWAEEARRIQNANQNYTDAQVWRTLLWSYDLLEDNESHDKVYDEYRIVSSIDPYHSILFNISEIDNLYEKGNVEEAMTMIPYLDSLSHSLSVNNYSSLGRFIEECKSRFLPEKRSMFDYYSGAFATIQDLGDFEKNTLKSAGYEAFNNDDFITSNFLLKLAYEENCDDMQYLYTCFQTAHECKDYSFCDVIKKDITSLVRQQMKSVIGLTDAEKESYWQGIKEIQDLLFCYRDDDSSDELLYDFLLTSKSFLLRSNLTFNYVLRESNNAALIELGNSLKNTKRAISEGINSLLPETLDSLRLREIELNREIASKIQDFSVFDIYGMYSFHDVSNVLKDNETAIEFVNYPNANGEIEYAALINRHNLPKPVFVRLCTEDKLLAVINVEPQKLYDKDLPFSNNLFKIIWEPIWQHLTMGGKLYVSATGYLNTIALEAITTPSGKYIEEEITVNRVTSTSELCDDNKIEDIDQATIFGGIKYESNNNDESSDDLIYLDTGYLLDRSAGQSISYLPATKTEAETIARMLNKNKFSTSLYIGYEGSEEEFKRLSGRDVSLLHMATHGFYKPKDKTRRIGFYESLTSQDVIAPLQRSGLLLASCSDAWNGVIIKGREDGVLTASEIAEMDLSSTRLVVLSACESGLGEMTDDGVAGLQRAFKNAGVQTLVMSLWKVDDNATEILMTDFYKNITNGMSFNDAFTSAKLKLKNSKKYSNPYYWASFIILD